MSEVGPRHSPGASRFRKGQSGNPNGRPRAAPRPSPSAFDIILDRTLTVTQNRKQRELTVEEALQHRTYQEAIAGARLAQRAVLKMIAKREKWFAANSARKHPSVKRLVEPRDPDNADEALLILGIAEADNRWDETPGEPRRLLLQRWAVQRALSRGRRPLSASDISEIERCTRDAQTLRWPAGSKDEQDG